MSKQVLLFIEFGHAEGRPYAPAIPQQVPFKKSDVQQVWTLCQYRDKAAPPALPYTPVHGLNAFVEDFMHDWNIDSKRAFRYGSRITDSPVWVLVELK